MNFSEYRDPSGTIFQTLGASLQNYGLRVNFKDSEGPLCKISKITDFWIYSGIEKFVDWVRGSWTGGALGSTVDRSRASIETPVVHGRCTARRARGLTGGAGEGAQGRARPGDGSLRRNPQQRGDATEPETATVVAPRRWWCKRLGGEESEGEGVEYDGDRCGPFIVAGEGRAWARKGEMAGGNGLNAIEGGATS
jgi:hypothetical protein